MSRRREEFRSFREIQYYFDIFRKNDDDELWGIQTVEGLPRFINYDSRIDTFIELKEKINVQIKKMGIDNNGFELPKNLIVIFIEN